MPLKTHYMYETIIFHACVGFDAMRKLVELRPRLKVSQ